MLEWRIRKKIEWAFYNYETIKADGANYIADQYEAGMTAKLDNAGHGNKLSDPTANKAIKLVMNDAVRWCRMVERTYERYAHDEIKTKFMVYRYKRKITIDQLYCRYYKEFYVSERKTFYNWLDEILTYAAMVAIQEGLIKI